MKARISPNLVLSLEAETTEEAALLRLLDTHRIVKNGSGCSNVGGSLPPNGRREYLSFKFEPPLDVTSTPNQGK